MKWQPIETAPKDQHILEYRPTSYHPIGISSWTKTARGLQFWARWSGETQVWNIENAPTHWMPLPDLPTSTDEPTGTADDLIPDAIRKLAADPERVRLFNEMSGDEVRALLSGNPAHWKPLPGEERPIQVGDTVRHRTDPAWGTQVVASIGDPYVSPTITDTPVFFEAGGFWRLSQLQRIDPPAAEGTGEKA